MTSTKLKVRIVAILLVLATIFSMLPAMATMAMAAEGDKDAFGFLELKVTPIMGDGRELPGKSSSILANIMLDSKGNVIQAESVAKLRVEATYSTGGMVSPTEKVFLAVQENKPVQDPASVQGHISAVGQTVHFEIPVDQSKSSTIWYLSAKTDSGHTAAFACNIEQFSKATYGIRFKRIGMQIRGVDDTPIGKYDYIARRGALEASGGKAPNTTGIYRNEDSSQTGSPTTLGSYTGMNGATYSDCYFDVEIGSTVGGTGVVGVTNEEELYRWLGSVYMPAATGNGIDMSNKSTVTLKGPAYIECYDVGGAMKSKQYNMAYYTQSSTAADNPNSYVGWGNNAKRDFDALKYFELVIPTILIGTATVNYFDMDAPETPLHTQTVFTGQFRVPQSLAQFEEQMFYGADGLSAIMSNVYQNFLGGWDSLFRTNFDKYFEFYDMVQTMRIDPATGIVTSNGEVKDAESVSEAIQVRKSAMESLKQSKLLSPFLGFKSIHIPQTYFLPGIGDMEFQFGYGVDALSQNSYGISFVISGTKEAELVAMQNAASITLNLYYKTSGPTTYTVKVTNNGIVQDSLTRVYPGTAGQIIEEKDVDTSVVPPSMEIDRITPVPLPLVKDPTKNIIVIECSSDEVPYKVNYYLDNVLKESEDYAGATGTVISEAPIKGFPGYNYSHTDGLPLTLVDPGAIIRVYYTKAATAAPAATVNAKLYKDKNYSQGITVSKSGYGVYGYFWVDVSQYVNKTETMHWTVYGGCSPSGRSRTVDTYQNVSVTATATYNDAYRGNKGASPATVDMTFSHKVGNIWYFKFPVNSGSNLDLAKAYIPVGWKDNTNWKITFNAKVSYEEVSWSTGNSSTSCDGHARGCRASCPKDCARNHGYNYCRYTVHPLIGPAYNRKTDTTKSGSASLKINGSMYEDDFTGGKK